MPNLCLCVCVSVSLCLTLWLSVGKKKELKNASSMVAKTFKFHDYTLVDSVFEQIPSQ